MLVTHTELGEGLNGWVVLVKCEVLRLKSARGIGIIVFTSPLKLILITALLSTTLLPEQLIIFRFLFIGFSLTKM